jgi:hypothetical protein
MGARDARYVFAGTSRPSLEILYAALAVFLLLLAAFGWGFAVAFFFTAQ